MTPVCALKAAIESRLARIACDGTCGWGTSRCDLQASGVTQPSCATGPSNHPARPHTHLLHFGTCTTLFSASLPYLIAAVGAGWGCPTACRHGHVGVIGLAVPTLGEKCCAHARPGRCIPIPRSCLCEPVQEHAEWLEVPLPAGHGAPGPGTPRGGLRCRVFSVRAWCRPAACMSMAG